MFDHNPLVHRAPVRVRARRFAVVAVAAALVSAAIAPASMAASPSAASCTLTIELFPSKYLYAPLMGPAVSGTVSARATTAACGSSQAPSEPWALLYASGSFTSPALDGYLGASYSLSGSLRIGARDWPVRVALDATAGAVTIDVRSTDGRLSGVGAGALVAPECPEAHTRCRYFVVAGEVALTTT